MKEKNIKFILELIFIFILPLLFICFTSEIQVEKNFTYDNEGNFQISEDTKKLSFDNSVIKYTKQIQESDLLLNYFSNPIELDKLWYIPEQWVINTETIFYAFHDNEKDEIVIMLDDISEELIINDTMSSPIYISKDGELVINNVNYYIYDTSIQDLSIDISEYNNVVDNMGYYTYTNISYTTNTIWGNIKELLITYLDLNDNLLLDIVLCYTLLWFVMWIIWHLLYLPLDFICSKLLFDRVDK